MGSISARWIVGQIRIGTRGFHRPTALPRRFEETKPIQCQRIRSSSSPSYFSLISKIASKERLRIQEWERTVLDSSTR